MENIEIDKYTILDNVEEYSAEDLVEFIHKKIIIYEELKTETNGQFDARKRLKVKKLLENGDPDDWTKAQQDRTSESLQQYLDTYPNGQFRFEAKELLKEIQLEVERAKNITVVDKAWNDIDKKSSAEILNFIQKYPNSRYEVEANELLNNLILVDVMDLGINSLVSQIKQYETSNEPIQIKDDNIIDSIKTYLNENTVTKNEFLNIIKEDNNLLNSGIIKRLLKDKVIDLKDLFSLGIHKEFIQKMIKGENPQILSTPQRLDKIHKIPSTEIYFWGIPSSGKSCALGAILSVAKGGRGAARSMDPDIHSQGHGYMKQLMNLFKSNKVGTLMGGTSIDAFYEMGFDLYNHKRNRFPFTFIDMAGELMRCMHKENANEELDKIELIMLDTLSKVLIDNPSKNRKVHMFVIEYGAEEKLYEGLPQDTFLEGAASYIKNTGIFKKETDAIYLMITKADKAKDTSPEALNKYINENYLGFYNALEQICKENEINGGKVEKIAFSLGEVCFQNYCLFNTSAAENVVRILLDRSGSFKGGILGKLIGIFTK